MKLLYSEYLLQLFNRRLRIANLHPELEKHIEILQKLGVNGMSSDESDKEELGNNADAQYETLHYHVLAPQWRAPNLSFWLSQFDAAHTVNRRTSPGGYRGAWPRMRSQNEQDPQISPSTGFVPNLPANVYY